MQVRVSAQEEAVEELRADAERAREIAAEQAVQIWESKDFEDLFGIGLSETEFAAEFKIAFEEIEQEQKTSTEAAKK